jgi:glucosamine kinase
VARLVLGIDGGGTKTRCLVADRSGRILGEGLAGPSNHQVVGKERAAATVLAAVDQALAVADATLADVDVMVAGMAGVGRPEDQATVTEALALPPAVKLILVPDARVALAGALGGKPGAVLVSGTGSIAYGVDADGRTVRAGGWGWILGDEGSGFDIGRRAIAAALAELDGTGPATGLGEAICREFGLERLEQVVPRVYGDVAESRPRIAGLVPMVIAAAEQGDAVAGMILARAGRDLCVLATAVLRRLAIREPLVTLTGGVLSGCRQVAEAMERDLADMVPGARLVESAGTPAEGAILMALQV